MAQEQAIVKSQVLDGSPAPAGETSETAERIRRDLARAWGDMGTAWGVQPVVARVHGYLLAQRVPKTEREIREALEISHRAASIALAESEQWGLVERVPEPRRVGRRGPAGTAFVAVGDHWEWLGRVVAQRKLREGDPIVTALDGALKDATAAARANPDDTELAELRDWLTGFVGFVRLFDRAIGLVPRLEPRELERTLRLLGEVPDDVVLRLVRLLASLPDADVVPLLNSLSRLSPVGARRATRLLGGLVRPLR